MGKTHQLNSTSKSMRSNCTNRRMLFIASDHKVLKDVLKEANSKWKNKYQIFHGKNYGLGIITILKQTSIPENSAILGG